MRETITNTIESARSRLYETSQHIGHHPELGNEEYEARQALTALLEAYGFTIEDLPGQPETAFKAVYTAEKPGAHIGFLAEYDALPGLGHACGHNLIGTQSAAAAIGYKSIVEQTGGTITVFGTPAEETNGAKVTMAEDGLFDHLDAALMAHPSSDYVKSGTSLAMDAVEFSFHGRSSHAAAAPEAGINALDAVLQLFHSVNALRQHVTPDVRMHGIITHGGTAANVVPEFAQAQFYVRAAKRSSLNPLAEKVKECARAAAQATGATVEIRNYEYSYDDMKTNEALSNVFTKQLHTLGVRREDIFEEEDGSGSLDMGNVSQRCPALHPYTKISSKPIIPHTDAFREAALSDEGFEGMMLTAKALALTAMDVAVNEDVRRAVHREFHASR
ncbi:M20 family metallopeptidase [Alkalicoccus urumqiensis]|uniref:Peptidase M20 domain-containing protein 2 n=1 Tax=Alkalicoccus urumqiensis TaxID=1548213 RepID=A0A2P6MK66_ALKUR|nr:M20 family metallopeptidase [Alkalicoccus urumqiensis]PRO66653.1 amidohydrolase [Alkalicoccus urumqiensis]